jgi:glucose/arabinose dehydrogenase
MPSIAPRLAALGLVLVASFQLGANGCFDASFGAVTVATGLSAPVLVAAPEGDPRLFVVERAGRIRIVNAVTGGIVPTPFLDISSRVATTGERGLLGLAFAPDFAQSGEFYVYYVQNPSLDSVVSRFTLATPTSNVANPASEEVVLRVPPTTAQNHKGGTVEFSPLDGMLYFALGDGGESFNTAQDPTTLYGKMLRIDVSAGLAGYSIPPDNPFVGDDGVRDEIWDFGFRNPFRFGFDRDTGELWIADVGAGTIEEVNLEAPGDGGRNYGWPVHEGSLCIRPGGPGGPCDDPANPTRFTFPVDEYDHTLGCSITGGHPYRGASSSWHGSYFFADFCSDLIWSLGANFVRADRTQALARLGAVFMGIVGISEDGYGELYLSNLQSGVIHHVRLSPDSDQDRIPDLGDNCPFVANRDQADADDDGRGDACDG